MLHVVKVRIYPTEEQQQFLRGQFGAVRYCYNKAVAIKKHRYKVHLVRMIFLCGRLCGKTVRDCKRCRVRPRSQSPSS